MWRQRSRIKLSYRYFKSDEDRWNYCGIFALTKLTFRYLLSIKHVSIL